MLSPERPSFSVDDMSPDTISQLQMLISDDSHVTEEDRDAILKDFLETYGEQVLGSRVAIPTPNAVMLVPLIDVVRNILQSRGRSRCVK